MIFANIFVHTAVLLFDAPRNEEQHPTYVSKNFARL